MYNGTEAKDIPLVIYYTKYTIIGRVLDTQYSIKSYLKMNIRFNNYCDTGNKREEAGIEKFPALQVNRDRNTREMSDAIKPTLGKNNFTV